MRKSRVGTSFLSVMAVLLLSVPAAALSPTKAERTRCRAWVKEHFCPAGKPHEINVAKTGRRAPCPAPFSFVYDGKPSADLLPSWRFKESSEKLDSVRIRRTQIYTDTRTGLEVRVALVEYADYPTAEWTVYFKNTGTSDTPAIEDVRALNSVFERIDPGGFKLRHFTGSLAREDDYQPFESVLGPGEKKRITSVGGRPTNGTMCYFNLELAVDRGLVIALGWPGQWAADFVRDSGRGLRVACGQELVHLRLHPGEEIRTPLVVLQFWQGGDWIRAQNVWRRWMVAHNMPHPGGKPMTAQYGACFGSPRPAAAQEIAEIDAYLRDGVTLDHWIIDAGWYPMNGTEWWTVGTWEVDTERFPKGLREVADHAHEKGIDFIVWFEPERVSKGTWLDLNHPDWVLHGDREGLLNLGNTDARRWVTEFIDGMLVSQGIDHLRSDFNIDPLDYWRKNDTADRQGITENFYVQGFLAFWDELLRRHPKMYIDTCASGGRRNDLETLRRSVPLLRSDYPLTDFTIRTSHGQQCQTYGISFWIPYHGTGAPNSDPYTLRSAYCPAYRIGYDALDPKRNVELFRRTVEEIRRILTDLLANYYPLTPYSLEKSKWMAWQYDSPERGTGVVQAFRRDSCATDSMRFKLRGLAAKSLYEVTDMDSGIMRKIKGRDLMDRGLDVRIPAKPGSALLVYQKFR